MIDFQTHPDRYRHWRLTFDGPVATLALDVSEDGGIVPGYELKLNSYDLGVDIELHDAIQRLRFEHPEIGAVILTSARDRVFCAGANIRALAAASHPFKVNFCRFTNETRIAIEDASRNSDQTWLTAINGSCAGGGYEMALATEHILMADDGSTAVSLPEIPLLAVLPGTGGLTRLVDKRRVRRDLADAFSTTEEGVRGARAVEWGLVDEVVSRTKLLDIARERAHRFAASSSRPRDARGIVLGPLERRIEADRIVYTNLKVEIERSAGAAYVTIHGPDRPAPSRCDEIHAQGDRFWPLAVARELDDAICHLRFNEETIGAWVFRTEGDAGAVAGHDRTLLEYRKDWLVNEIILYLKRTLARLEVTSRSIFALLEPGSCFAGTLFELALAADRSWMLSGRREGDETPPATIMLTEANFGLYPMLNGLTRLGTRFLGADAHLERLRARIGDRFEAEATHELGLVTFAPDDLDWQDEVRIALEERAAFSPDALTGMEASLRFAGPETMETKIFARLSAWQNWIFQRPNAAGATGALKTYGTGKRAEFDRRRA